MSDNQENDKMKEVLVEIDKTKATVKKGIDLAISRGLYLIYHVKNWRSAR